jgi:hypothetical protein
MRNRRQRKALEPRPRELTASFALDYMAKRETRLLRKARAGKMGSIGEQALLDDWEGRGQGPWLAVGELHRALEVINKNDHALVTTLLERAHQATATLGGSQRTGISQRRSLAVLTVVKGIRRGRHLGSFDKMGRKAGSKTGAPVGSPLAYSSSTEGWDELIAEIAEVLESTGQLKSRDFGPFPTAEAWVRAHVLSVSCSEKSLDRALRYLVNRGLVEGVKCAWTRHRVWRVRYASGELAFRHDDVEVQGHIGRIRLKREYSPESKVWVTSASERSRRESMTPRKRWEEDQERKRAAERDKIGETLVEASPEVLEMEAIALAGVSPGTGEAHQVAASAFREKTASLTNQRKLRTLRAVEGHLKAREVMWMKDLHPGSHRVDESLRRLPGVWTDVYDLQEHLRELEREELELRLVEGIVQKTAFGEERWHPVVTGSIVLQRVLKRGIRDGRLDGVARLPLEIDGKQVDLPSRILGITHVRLRVAPETRALSCPPPRVFWPTCTETIALDIDDMESPTAVAYGAEPWKPTWMLKGTEGYDRALHEREVWRAEQAMYRRKKQLPLKHRADLV